MFQSCDVSRKGATTSDHGQLSALSQPQALETKTYNARTVLQSHARITRMEPTEIQEFSNQLKEAGEGKKEESLTSISLAISILAVLVAMVTVLGHRTHTEAVLMEGRATDQWNEYQAKKIRQDNLSVVVETLGLNGTPTPAVQQKIGEFKAHIAKWKDDLVEQQSKAHEFEAEVTHAERQAGRYDLGEALLQIAVVLCSVTLFTRKRTYFFFGLSLGVAGLIVAATALIVH